VIRTPVQSPRANSYAERFVGTLRRECLDHMLILGERQLWKVLDEYARHWPSGAVDITARIERRGVLDGLISEYRRAA
jgi:transposase InsO family protein